MKILLISKAMTVSATLSKANLLANQVDLILVTPKKWPYYVKENNIESLNYRHVELDVIFPGKNHFHFYLGVKKLIESFQPDIIHIDEEHYSFVTFQINWIAKRMGIKTICFTWQNIYKKYPFPFSYFEQYNLKESQQIIAGNEEAAAVLIKKGFNKPIPIIPQFGVDRNIFFKKRVDRGRFGLATDKFIVGFVGRIVEEKGISTLVEAVAKLKNVQLCIAGTGPYEATIRQQTVRLGISERVLFLGGFSSTEIVDFICSCDCIALPSLTKKNWKEQFGRILIEAMACGIPVIGSSSGEIPKVIGDEGIIFREQDAVQCASAIEKIKTDSDYRERIIQGALQKVKDHFSQDVIVKKTIDVYKNILR